MDVEINPVEGMNSSAIDLNMMIDHLISKPEIQFKSQQRDESELTNIEKREISTEIFHKSKFTFLNRFGKYLDSPHLTFFYQFINQTEEGKELEILLTKFKRSLEKSHREKRNRRYEALKQLIDGEAYFSETEMMKRNPLLYEQLVGQYLSEEEIRSRDRSSTQSTFVGILMEGIERDNARDIRKKQEEAEDDCMEEEEESSDEDEVLVAQASKWGECSELADNRINKEEFYPKKNNLNLITADERRLLKDEFVTFMHQSFLDGLDEDFDYKTVDENEDYDNIDIVTHDEEEKYFDSEEPDEVDMEVEGKKEEREESSEDELDMYMSALNQHPAVTSLSNQLKRL